MAIIGSLPFTLVNGQTADATQVMADFNTIVSNVNASAAANGVNSDITSLSALSTPLSVPQGGTGIGSVVSKNIVIGGGTGPFADSGVPLISVVSKVPKFRAGQVAAPQITTGGSFTKVTLDSVTFDTNANFANSRFTPTVAGYYQITVSITSQNTGGTTSLLAAIYKNGSAYSISTGNAQGAAGTSATTVSDIVFCNGSTDFIEAFTNNTDGAVTLNNDARETYMCGVLV